MNFLTRWENACVDKCLSLFKWRVKYFFYYVALRKGSYLVAVHTIANGLLLLIPLFGISDDGQEGKCQAIFPEDARLLCGLLGSPLLVLGLTLLIALVKTKPFLIIYFVIGLQTLIILFPLLFTVAYVRTFILTADYFKKSKAHLPENVLGIEYQESFIFFLFYIVLTYILVFYFVHFYYVVVIISYLNSLRSTAGSDKTATEAAKELKPEESLPSTRSIAGAVPGTRRGT